MAALAIEQLTDPVTFCESLLTYQGKPLRLYNFQKNLLHDVDFLNDRICVLKGRAIGASFLVAVACCFYLFCFNDIRLGVISKTERQSGWIFEHTCRFLKSSPILSRYIDRSRTKVDELWLTNGSMMVHRTAGVRGDTLRGFHVEGRGAVVFDESSSIPSKAIETIYPSAVGAGIVHVSTPKQPSGEFHRCATADPDFRTIKIPSTRSPRITERDLALWKRIYSPSRYRNEVLAEFSAGEDCVFDAESIDRAIDDSLPLFDPDKPFVNWDRERNYVYSLDISRIGADRWVLTIGDVDDHENSLRVVAYHSWAGSMHEDKGLNAEITDNPSDIISGLLQYARRFYPIKVYADATSNEFFCHTLRHRYNLPVEDVVWSTSRKQRLMEHLASCFRADKIKIPNDEELIDQLLNYSYDTKRMEDDSDRKIYLAGDDDMVSSLAMLAQSISWDEGSEWCKYLEVA